MAGDRFPCDGAGGGPKDFTALGGKVGSAGPGVETEEGEGVEVGRDGVKLLTLGVGEVDKDAVLQAGKAQIDRLKAASQEIVFEVLDIIGSLSGGGVETPRLGLVKKIVNEVNELAAGFSNFGNHKNSIYLYVCGGLRPVNFLHLDHHPAKPPRGSRLGTGLGRKFVLDFQWRHSPRDGRRFLRSTGSG